jgi:hypothetical protein
MLKPMLALAAVGVAFTVLVASPAMTSNATLTAQTTAAPAPTTAPTLPGGLKPLFAGITLSDAQIKQVASVHQKHMGAIGDSTAGMGAGAVDHRAEEAKELRTALLPDQQKMYDANLAKVKASWTKKPGY